MNTEQAFQVGEEVEVLPAPERACWDWQRVAGKRGRVTQFSAQEAQSIQVVFDRDNARKRYWWCAPDWLRHLQPPGGPLFKVGDEVDMGDFSGGEVIGVDAEPRYSVQWPDGHVQRIKESTLRRHGVMFCPRCGGWPATP